MKKEKNEHKNEHIKDIDISNFTCFNKLEIKNCKRINIVFGSNGCGKTYLLRCIDLLINRANNENAFTVSALDMIQSLSNLDEFLNDDDAGVFDKDKNTQNTLNKLSHFFNPNPFNISCSLSDEKAKIDIDRTYMGAKLSNSRPYRHYRHLSLQDFERNERRFFNKNAVYVHGEDNWKLGISTLMDKMGKNPKLLQEMLEYVKIFYPNAINISQHPRSGLNLFLKDHEETPIGLGYHGYGFKRFIMMIFLCSINKGGTVVIDEIENGLHFDKYQSTANCLIETSKKSNTQIFTTSHSNEYVENLLEKIIKLGYGDDCNIIHLKKDSLGGVIADSFESTEEALSYIQDASYSSRIV